MSLPVCKTIVTFRLLQGPEVDPDWLLDSFAGTIGRQNGAQSPLKVVVATPVADDWPIESVYEVEEVDGL